MPQSKFINNELRQSKQTKLSPNIGKANLVLQGILPDKGLRGERGHSLLGALPTHPHESSWASLEHKKIHC